MFSSKHVPLNLEIAVEGFSGLLRREVFLQTGMFPLHMEFRPAYQRKII